MRTRRPCAYLWAINEQYVHNSLPFNTEQSCQQGITHPEVNQEEYPHPEVNQGINHTLRYNWEGINHTLRYNREGITHPRDNLRRE